MPNKHLDKIPKADLKEMQVLLRKIEMLIDVEHRNVKDYLQVMFMRSVIKQKNTIENEIQKRNERNHTPKAANVPL